ncbi:hemolysin-III related-domain-containing protein [Apodospora peruviana]|uniref:Hemolysin-III related-domain-containing protein n=1 Tax=Apodospora peruviana TaxID=516989 RepID=A0AAE0IKK2_9PEZI|nr:hemolysin-III related-domain-containing protein [Apodospora peruviana]
MLSFLLRRRQRGKTLAPTSPTGSNIGTSSNRNGKDNRNAVKGIVKVDLDDHRGRIDEWTGGGSSLREKVKEAEIVAATVEKEVERRIELLLWADVPHWQQHGSELIHTGYRKACGSVRGCLHSWTYVHNETVNIYSHVIGATIFFLILPLWIITTTLPPRYAIATPADILVCGVWFLGVGVCFVLSTIFHTFMSHSASVYLLGMKLDFQGILLLMWGSTAPLIYYSFPCQTKLQATYFCLTTVLAVLCSVTTLWSRFSGPHVGHYRAALFGSFGGGSFLAPVVHGIAVYGYQTQSRRIALGWILRTVLFNGVGVVVYTLKFPEKWYPRRFDLFGASHQLMHVMVLFAALSYTMAMLGMFDSRHENGCLAAGLVAQS